MLIHYTTPYSKEKKLYEAYNAAIAVIGENDWCFFIDGDAMFTTHDFGDVVSEYITAYPHTGCFVAMTNRVGSGRQLHNEYSGDDVVKHRDIGQRLRDEKKNEIENYTKPQPCHFSGVGFCLSKKTWKGIGGFEPYNEGSGILGVDSKIHQKLYENGYDTLIMKGLYLYHWYRGGNNYKHHLK